MSKTVVIAGASGVVGQSALNHYLEQGWNVVALSRRQPMTLSDRPFRHLPVDLRDADATRSALESVGPVDQLVYSALYEKPGLIAGWREADQMDTNRAMLANTVEALTQSGLGHVVLLQGTKAYGVHVMPLRIPAKESQPRVQHENFYWLQEDYLSAAAREKDFSYTIFRPQFVIGDAIGSAMNLVALIGIYGSICAREGRPFGYPGGASYVAEATDARLLAKAFLWSESAAAARDETFNITNGDVFEWRDMWPALGQALGATPGPDDPTSMAEFLPAHESTWRDLIREHDLRDLPMAAYLGESHHYADYAFGYDSRDRTSDHGTAPAFVSSVKLRRAGLVDVYDTQESFIEWFDIMRRLGILPPG